MKGLLCTLFLGLLSLEDLKYRSLSRPALCAFAAVGAIVRFRSGISPADAVILLTAFSPGLLLLAASRITRGAIGKGDALCFLILSLWLSPGELITLLLSSLLLFALLAAPIQLIRRRSLRQALPFLPFVLGTRLLLLLGGVIPLSSR